jgi:hypothetical protein
MLSLCCNVQPGSSKGFESKPVWYSVYGLTLSTPLCWRDYLVWNGRYKVYVLKICCSRFDRMNCPTRQVTNPYPTLLPVSNALLTMADSECSSASSVAFDVLRRQMATTNPRTRLFRGMRPNVVGRAAVFQSFTRTPASFPSRT